MHRRRHARVRGQSQTNSSTLIARRRRTALTAAAFAGAAALIGAAARQAAAATVAWNGTGADQNWSTAANWTGGLPAANDVLFGNTGAASVAGLVNNITDQSLTLNSLTYNENYLSNVATPSIFQTTQINPGVTLNITGTNGVRVGLINAATNADTTVGAITRTMITGAGTLNISNTNGVFIVTNDTQQTNGNSSATLDMHGLSTFTANVNNFGVGVSTAGTGAEGTRSQGAVYLADTSTITTGTMTIGWDNTNGRNNTLALGRANTINVDSLYVGRDKATGFFGFTNTFTGSTLLLRGRAGGNSRVALFDVGDESQQTNSGTSLNATVDLRGGAVDALVNNLQLGVAQNAGNNSPGGFPTVNLFFDTGTFDATTVTIGRATGASSGGGKVVSTLNVGGTGVFTAGSITIAQQTSNAPATGNLLMTGGTLNVTTGDIIDGGGNSTLNVGAGATLDMQPAGRAAAAGNIGGSNGIDTFVLNGTIAHVNNLNVNSVSGAGVANVSGLMTTNINSSSTFDGAINGSAALLKLGGDTLTFTGSQGYTGNTTISSGTLSLTGNGSLAGNTITITDGANFDVSAVNGGYTLASGKQLGGQGNVNGSIAVASGAVLAPGTAAGAVGTLSFNNDLTLNNGSKLRFELSPDASSNNDQLNIGGNLFANGVVGVDIGLTGPSVAMNQPYVLINAGNIPASVLSNFTLVGTLGQTRLSATFTNPNANQVALTFSGAGPASLIWHSADSANGNWNVLGDANWLNGAVQDKFYQFDAVTFDDAGAAVPVVNIADNVLVGGVTVNSAGNYAFTGTGKIGGGAMLTKDGSGLLTVANSGVNDYTGGTLINAGAVQVGNGGTSGSLGTGGVTNNATLVLDVAGNYTFANNIAGSGGVVANGGGTVTLLDGNTYTGATTVTAGTILRAAGNSSFGFGAIVVQSGATLDTNGQNLGGNGNSVTVGGTGAPGAGGAIVNNSTNAQINTLTGVTLTGDTTFGGTGRWDIRSNGGASLDMAGATLTKSGTNQVSLVGVSVANPGNIVVNQGLFSIETSTDLGGSAANTLTVNAGAGQQFWANTVPLNWTLNANGGKLNNGSGTGGNWAGPVNVNADTTFEVSTGTTFTISGNMAGTGALTKTSNGTNTGGTLVLSGANSAWSGSTTISAGAITVASDTALGSSTAPIPITATPGAGGGGSALNLNNANLTSRDLLMDSNTTGDLRTALSGVGTGPASYTGNITMTGNGTTQLFATGAGLFTVGGSITATNNTVMVRGTGGPGALNSTLNLGPNTRFFKTDSGVWTINSTGNHMGAVGVAAGTLKLGADNALDPTAVVTIGQSGNTVATLDLNGHNQAVGGLLSDPASTSLYQQQITNSGAQAATLTVGGAASTTYAGQFNGNTSLNKSGSGVLTISGTNSYSGATIISGGTLRLAAAPTAAAADWVADSLSALGSGAAVTTWTDSIAAKNATVGINAPTLNTAALNGHSVVTFDANSTQSLQVAAADSPISGARDFTVAVVFRTNTPGSGTSTNWYQGAGLVDAEQANSVNDWGTSLDANGRFLGGIGNPDRTVANAGSLANGNGHVAIYSYSTTTGQLTLSIDGVNYDQTGGGTNARNVNRFTIGQIQTATATNNANFFTGDIAEVRMYTSAVTPGSLIALGNSLASTYGITASYGNFLPTNTPVQITAAGASLDINGNAVSIGSLSGVQGATVALGNNGSLTTGTDNTSTTYSGAFTGTGNVAKVGTGTQTLDAPGATHNLNAVTASSGSLVFGPTTTLNAAGTLSVSAGANVNFTASGTTAAGRLTHTANDLAIAGTGATIGNVDLGNHELLLKSANPQSVKSYLASAYDPNGNADWGQRGLTSSLARANPTSYSVGYAYGGDPSAQDAGVTTHGGTPLGATQTLIRPVLTGDANLDGKVDFFDISQVLGYRYNAGGNNAPYTDGDLNYDGKVDFFDIVTLLSANYNSGQTFGPAQAHAGAAAPMAVTLTNAARTAGVAASASTSATTLGVSGDGKPDFVYDPTTGDLKFHLDGATLTTTGGQPSFVSTLLLTSTAGDLQAGGASATFAGGTGATLTSTLLSSALTNTPGFGDSFDLGPVLGMGLSLNDIAADLTLQYQVLNGGGLVSANLNSTVPEPTSLAILGLGAAGLMTRRRRNRRSAN